MTIIEPDLSNTKVEYYVSFIQYIDCGKESVSATFDSISDALGYIERTSNNYRTYLARNTDGWAAFPLRDVDEFRQIDEPTNIYCIDCDDPNVNHVVATITRRLQEAPAPTEPCEPETEPEYKYTVDIAECVPVVGPHRHLVTSLADATAYIKSTTWQHRKNLSKSIHGPDTKHDATPLFEMQSLMPEDTPVGVTCAGPFGPVCVATITKRLQAKPPAAPKPETDYRYLEYRYIDYRYHVAIANLIKISGPRIYVFKNIPDAVKYIENVTNAFRANAADELGIQHVPLFDIPSINVDENPYGIICNTLIGPACLATITRVNPNQKAFTCPTCDTFFKESDTDLIIIGPNDTRFCSQQCGIEAQLPPRPKPKCKKIQTFWGSSDRVRSEYTLIDGVKQGALIQWYENGEKESECYFVDGELDGLYTQWREDGTKIRVSRFRMGNLHGEVNEWHEDGSLLETVIWEKGIHKSTTEYQTNVEPAEEPKAAFGFSKALIILKNGGKIARSCWHRGDYLILTVGASSMVCLYREGFGFSTGLENHEDILATDWQEFVDVEEPS